MGWLYQDDASFDRRALLAHLRSPHRLGSGVELIRSSAVGNHHWYVYRVHDTGRIGIGLDLMKPGGRDCGWGYKSLDESAGPYYYDCPLGYLEVAPEPTSPHAAEWRRKVRQHHSMKAARPKPAAGMVVRIGNCTLRLTDPAGPRRGWNAVDVHCATRYRVPAAMLAKAEVVAQPEQGNAAA